MIQELVYLLSLCLGVGIACAMLFVFRPNLESGFFRTTSSVASSLLLISFFTLWKSPDSLSSLKYTSLWLGLLLLFYATTVRWLPLLIERFVLGVVSVWGSLSIWKSVSAMNSNSFLPWADGTFILSGALIMGLALVAMNVGHSYLASAKRSLQPLRYTTLGLGVMIILRSFALGVLFFIILRSFPLASEEFQRLTEIQNLTFLVIGAIRVLFGLIGPLILIYMTWETVKLESTQSATGILYGVLAMVLAGEASAMFLILNTGFPV